MAGSSMVEQELAKAAWMVRVVVPGLSGGSPVESYYAVGTTGKLEAELAAHKQLGDVAIAARRPLTASEIEDLALKPGEVRSYT